MKKAVAPSFTAPKIKAPKENVSEKELLRQASELKI
jgi:hypothetical protein